MEEREGRGKRDHVRDHPLHTNNQRWRSTDGEKFHLLEKLLRNGISAARGKKKKRKKRRRSILLQELDSGAGNFSTRLKGYMGPARDPTHAQLLPRALWFELFLPSSFAASVSPFYYSFFLIFPHAHLAGKRVSTPGQGSMLFLSNIDSGIFLFSFNFSKPKISLFREILEFHSILLRVRPS